MQSLLVDQLHLEKDLYKGQVVVITGAGRGIGREAARGFASLGARVVIAELSDLGSQVEREIRESGGEALFVRTDVSREGDVARLAETVQRDYGGVDVLINNAIRCPAVSVSEMSIGTWDQVIAVNLRGTFLTCKAFLPGMLQRRRGTIINMISTDAMPGLSAYIASKQGINGFTLSLAVEVVGKGVCVIPFAPGMVDTPGIREVSGSLAQHLGISAEQFLGVSLHPAYGGMMPVEHAAAATIYLAGKLAKEYHGQVVNGYEVLERAGLIHAAPAQNVEVIPAMPEVPSQPALASAVLLSSAEETVGQLLEAIQQTDLEFNKLPIFARPLARNGFKSKAGQSLADWRHNLEELSEKLAQAKSGQGDALKSITAGAPVMRSRLEKLVTYYKGVPAETARFTRDEAMLKEVARISGERMAVIQALSDYLAQVKPEDAGSPKP